MPYDKGLHELGDACYAYLQPDGGWGWSNAGLVVGAGASLLVDTLFDLKLTREMLDAMAAPTAAAPIGTLLNTHANGDHCYGNQLVEGAEIVASAATAHEMSEVPPSMLHALNTAPGEVGELFRHCVPLVRPVVRGPRRRRAVPSNGRTRRFYSRLIQQSE